MAIISRSNKPQVLGFVSMIAATSVPSFDLKTSRSTRPCEFAGRVSTANPSAAAVAGLVPWADSGASTFVRGSPRAAKAALIVAMPQNSPWAPAACDMATAGIPVKVFSQKANWSISSSAPCTVERGCIGWRSAKPGRRASFSFSRGLCFMVHEPSG